MKIFFVVCAFIYSLVIVSVVLDVIESEGRSRGGQTRKEQLGTEGYQEMAGKAG